MDTSQGEGQPSRSRGRRWPLGLLTLIVVGVVVGGTWLFGGEEGTSPSTTTPGLGDLGLGSQTDDPAPDFALELLDGTEFRLGEHLATDGRPVILNLWASWCNPCRAEMPAFDTASQKHTDVFFIGIAVEDDPVAAEQFADEIGVSYALGIDEGEQVGRRYPSPGLPATFFISTEGGIVRTIFGQLDEEQIEQLIADLFGL